MDPNRPARQKTTSPWVYIGCGCGVLVALILAGIVGLSVLRSQVTTQRRQFRSLAIDNLEVCLFAQIQIAAFLDLRQFPFADDVCRAADAAAGVSCLKAAGEMKRVCEQVITKQYAGFVIPAGIHCCDVASGFGVVQYVIMNQRRQMNHLDNGSQHLYGHKVIEQVAEHSREMAAALGASTGLYKPLMYTRMGDKIGLPPDAKAA